MALRRNHSALALRRAQILSRSASRGIPDYLLTGVLGKRRSNEIATPQPTAPSAARSSRRSSKFVKPATITLRSAKILSGSAPRGIPDYLPTGVLGKRRSGRGVTNLNPTTIALRHSSHRKAPPTPAQSTYYLGYLRRASRMNS